MLTQDDYKFIIRNVFRMMRQQTDMRQQAHMSGTVLLRPRSFSDGKHLVLGPFKFGRTFRKPPEIAFGDNPEIDTTQVRVSSGPTSYTPFLVHPYVYSWTTSSGAVDGFNMGVYKLTDPVTLPTRHNIYWMVKGNASRYKDEGTTEAWTGAGDQSYPGYLVDSSDYT